MSNITEKIVIERNQAPFKIEIGFHTPDDGLDLVDVRYVIFDDRRLEPIGSDVAINILDISTELTSLMTDLIPRMCAVKPKTGDKRKHTSLTDEILKVIDQQPLNRYEVALRLTRWAEKFEEIAYQKGLKDAKHTQ